MGKFKILDCTLRDGGYVNSWEFGNSVIKKILKRLSKANIEIVEIGFLSDVEYNQDKTLFNSLEQIQQIIPEDSNSKYVGMIALGEKEIHYSKVPVCNGVIWGIRLTFHKNEIDRAFEYASDLMAKGYKIFMQPIGTKTYSDLEFLQLIDRINILKPYAFSVVDTLGNMTGAELKRLFHLADNNLAEEIQIGFHAHNNLQLAFSNAQEIIHMFSEREVIIDASVLGMGRGAGNLCTELIADYSNKHLKTHYNVTVLLEIIDKYLTGIQKEHFWGYSIQYCISAMYDCHPNYATYLMNLQTVNVDDIEKLIATIPYDKRAVYDKQCITALYQSYQTRLIDDREAVEKLKEKLRSRDVLVLAPGYSLHSEKEAIKAYIETVKPLIISVNFCNDMYPIDIAFISNLKRFSDMEFETMEDKDFIITSNIEIVSTHKIYRINYSDYLNGDEIVSDDAGLMVLKLLKKCAVKQVTLAGYDGFGAVYEENYFDKELYTSADVETLDMKTKGIKEQIRLLRRTMDISFLTTTQYERE